MTFADVVIGVQVGSASDAVTGTPEVAVWLRLLDGGRSLYVMDVELADHLAHELKRWAEQAAGSQAS